MRAKVVHERGDRLSERDVCSEEDPGSEHGPEPWSGEGSGVLCCTVRMCPVRALREEAVVCTKPNVRC